MNVKMSRIAGGLVAVAFASAANAQISNYSQDFESLDMGSATALGDDGWLVGANVFAPDGTTFLYDYFAFPAPNGGPAFSGVASGQGGPAQGAQQLVTYNDYNNGDHNVGNRIEANFFRDFFIDASNVGETWTFTYDAKAGDLGGASTAGAFIKTLDPNNGFATTNLVSNDTTNLPVEWGTYSLSLNIDAGLVGQIFQIGFVNTASNFEPSGNFYDNINVTPAPSAMALLGLAGLAGTRRRR